MSLKSLVTFRRRVRPHTILQKPCFYFYLRTIITPINILKHFWAQMLYVTTVIQVIQMPQVIVPSVCSHLVATKLPSLLSAPMQPSIVVDPDTHGYEWIRWIRWVFTQSTKHQICIKQWHVIHLVIDPCFLTTRTTGLHQALCDSSITHIFSISDNFFEQLVPNAQVTCRVTVSKWWWRLVQPNKGRIHLQNAVVMQQRPPSTPLTCEALPSECPECIKSHFSWAWTLLPAFFL